MLIAKRLAEEVIESVLLDGNEIALCLLNGKTLHGFNLPGEFL
jgi:hypothetical protein